MSALTIPPEVAAKCAQRLMEIAAVASRDAQTLTRQASVLLSGEKHGQIRAILWKYVYESFSPPRLLRTATISA